MEGRTFRCDTNQGSHYRATEDRDLLAKHGIVCSMSAKGCCWDNAVVANLCSTLKLDPMTIGKS